jgi:hypothetical protein
MSSIQDVSFYWIIISPHPSTFLLKAVEIGTYQIPTYLVALTSLVVFSTNLATTKNIGKKKKNKKTKCRY